MTVYFMWDTNIFPLFAECLKTLPNLHTLSIGSIRDFHTTPLEKALKGVKLPQIKTLTLPPAAYPLLQRCHDVEDVVCGIRDVNGPSGNEFLRSLVSNQDSRLKRLAIPLALLPNPSGKRSALHRIIG